SASGRCTQMLREYAQHDILGREIGSEISDLRFYVATMGLPLHYNLRNLIERKATTTMTAVGIALNVAVLITSVAMTNGMKAVFSGTGHPRQVIVLRKGTDSELNSSIKEDAYQIVRSMPGIAVNDRNDPMASPEAQTVVNLPS